MEATPGFEPKLRAAKWLWRHPTWVNSSWGLIGTFWTEGVSPSLGTYLATSRRRMSHRTTSVQLQPTQHWNPYV
jgi:hypothetical protein